MSKKNSDEKKVFGIDQYLATQSLSKNDKFVIKRLMKDEGPKSLEDWDTKVKKIKGINFK